MRRFAAAAIFSTLLAPAAFAGPDYVEKLTELNGKVGEASREIANALKVDDYAAACASSRREAQLMTEYAEMAFLHREALYRATGLPPEQLESRSNEHILPLILTATRARKTSADLCAKVSTTD